MLAALGRAFPKHAPYVVWAHFGVTALSWILYALGVFRSARPDESLNYGDIKIWYPLTSMVVFIGFAAFFMFRTYPRRTLVPLVLNVVAYWLWTFTTAYYALGGEALGSDRPFGRLDALYFATTIATTTGFGDFAPETSVARGVVTTQMLTGAVLLIGGVAIVLDRIGRDE